MEHLKKWWAVHAAWLISFVILPVLPAAQSFVAGHPKLTVALAGVSTIIAKITPSPAGN